MSALDSIKTRGLPGMPPRGCTVEDKLAYLRDVVELRATGPSRAGCHEPHPIAPSFCQPPRGAVPSPRALAPPPLPL